MNKNERNGIDVEYNLMKITPTFTVGQVFKNYKELCSALEILPTNGDSKDAQMAEIERFLDLDRNGHKFIVKKIYQVPKERVIDKRSIFAEDVEFVLVNGFKSNIEECHGDVCIITEANALAYCLCFGNNNLFYHNLPNKNFLEECDLTSKDFEDFYYAVRGKAINHIETGLDRLEKNRNITYNKRLYLLNGDKGRFLSQKEINTYNSIFNYTIFSFNKVPKIVLDCDIGYQFKSMRDIFKYRKVKEFYERLQENLEGEFGEGVKIFSVYDIRTTSKLLDYALLRIGNKSEVIEKQMAINSNFIESVKRSSFVVKDDKFSSEQIENMISWELKIRHEEFENHFNALMKGYKHKVMLNADCIPFLENRYWY